jgi:Ni/Fe-hydrogenase 1 B-type cytochrome subunit
MSTATTTATVEPQPLVREYVWQLPVRLTHWVIAGSIVVLSATGFYLGNPFVVVPGPAAQSFVTGTAKVIHFYAAICFTLAVLARIAWMFVGNRYARWSNFLPFRRGTTATLKFYLFVRRDPPEDVGHNPVAGVAYSAVFLLYLTAIATGLTLYGTSAHVESPLRFFATLAPWFGGLQTVRWIHHAVMWLLLGFAVHHVYSSVLMAVVGRNAIIDSIVTGYKFLKPQRPERK